MPIPVEHYGATQSWQARLKASYTTVFLKVETHNRELRDNVEVRLRQ
jgi:hypothetical protein